MNHRNNHHNHKNPNNNNGNPNRSKNRHFNKNRRNNNHVRHGQRPHDHNEGDFAQEHYSPQTQTILLSHSMEDRQFPKALVDLQKTKEQLETKLTMIKNRLTFGFSERLNEEYFDMVRQDMMIACEINEQLLALKATA